jgi:hypothetical protein
MDINKDLADPSEDIKKFDDGAYLYKSSTGDFDIDKFNRYYEQYRAKRKKQMERKMAKKLGELNKPKDRKPLYHDSVAEIMINTKDALFEILDDLLQRRFIVDTFIKNNRLFYIGLIMVFIACFMFAYTIIIGDSNDSSKENDVIRVNHIHKIISIMDKEL